MIAAVVLIILIGLIVAAAFVDLSGRWADTIGKGRDLWMNDQ